MPDRCEGRALAPSLAFESALRLAVTAHHGQSRRCSGVPYAEHPFAVALILDRAGFDEEVVIAGLLHDVVEDSPTTLDQIRDQFGGHVAELVAFCSEVKTDKHGQKRPWADRKRDHLAAIVKAPVEARAVVLADKLHNLLSILLDLREGRPVWQDFHANRDSVLAYYRSMIGACDATEPRLVRITAECRELFAQVAVIEP